MEKIATDNEVKKLKWGTVVMKLLKNCQNKQTK